VIDTQARIAGEAIRKYFQKCIDALARIEIAQCIAPAQLDEVRIGFADFWPEQRVIKPALRRIDIKSVGITL